eukprot:scaffold173664_cov33-Tisochrysis_lutea.AAC.2
MACSLLDVLKSGSVVFNKPGLCENLAIRYAIQLSQGMNYLHTCVHLHSPLHRRPMCKLSLGVVSRVSSFTRGTEYQIVTAKPWAATHPISSVH